MRTFIRGLALFSLLALSAPSNGARAQVGSPNLGALFNAEDGTVHPVPGIPNLVRIGPPLDLGTRIAAAAYSPDKDYVLAASAADSSILIVDRQGLRSLDMLDAVGRIALSPNGAYAALLDATRRRLIVMSGLPESPRLVTRAWLPSYHGVPSSVAVNDGGLVLTTYPDSGAVLAFASEDSGRRANFRLMGSFGRVTAMAFLPGRSDALIADDATDTLYLVRDIDTTPVRSVVADANDGIDRPVAVASSEDGTRFFLADAGAEAVIVAREAGRGVSVACLCVPSMLAPLQGNSVFALTAPGTDSSVWIMNGATDAVEIRPAPDHSAVDGQ